MSTVLLIFIYIIYIGLGIPDSVTGASWTTISLDLGIPIGYQSFITLLISLFTIIASAISPKLINKFGEGVVTAFSTLLTAIALFCYSRCYSIYTLCLCAIPAGLGAGAIDAALNNYVSVNYKPILVNFLHCFYGIGVFISPYVFSFTLKSGNWRLGYLTVLIIQSTLTLICCISLIFWKKVKRQKTSNGTFFKPVVVPYKTLLKNKAVRASLFVFFSTCALEFCCNYWGASYLEKCASITPDKASLYISLYFVAITLGRFIAGLLTTKLKVRTVIFAGYLITLIALLLLILPTPISVKGLSICLIGLGNGPIFPNFSYLTPKYFGKEYSQSIISLQMVSSNIAIMIMPAVFGFSIKFITLNSFPYYITLFFLIMVVSSVIYFNRVDKNFTSLVENKK